MTVLLLTKSFSYEQEFVKMLNFLGHEVLCSRQVFLDIYNQEEFTKDLDYFDTVIVSETISDEEAITCLSLLEKFRCSVVRKTLADLDDDMLAKWKQRGVSAFISQETDFEELREKLSNKDQKKPKVEPVLAKEKDITLENFDYSLTKQEYKAFRLLEQSKGKYITREDMCYALWNAAPSKSKESRLSGIIKSLKKKMAEYDLDETQLKTSWGNGYCLKSINSKKGLSGEENLG